jgi:hypothetical protein
MRDALAARRKAVAKELPSVSTQTYAGAWPAELVAHSALVHEISASGKVDDRLPGHVRTGELVHDVPKLTAG